MTSGQALDVNMFTSPFQLTKAMHRDVYPAVEPTNATLSAKGKVIIITGAGGGLGNASHAVEVSMIMCCANILLRLGYCRSLGSGWCLWRRAGWAQPRDPCTHI